MNKFKDLLSSKCQVSVERIVLDKKTRISSFSFQKRDITSSCGNLPHLSFEFFV